MESRCFRTILRISDKDHVVNEEDRMRNKIQKAIGPYEDLLTIFLFKLIALSPANRNDYLGTD